MAFHFPLVSVVVTTKNEEINISNCLTSIRNQTYPNVEVIVVDNNSTDSTKSIAKTFTSLVYNVGPERSAQRNFGMIEIASGKYVLYVDADMVLSPNLLSNCVTSLESSNLIALYIPELVLGKSTFARIRRFERQFYDATVIDAVRFFMRDKFCQSGGFDEKIFARGSGEDWDLDKQIKLLGPVDSVSMHERLDFNSEATMWFTEFGSEYGCEISDAFAGFLHNESGDRLVPYLQKKAYYSTGFKGYVEKWGSNDPDIKKQLGLRYRLCTVFMENGKWRSFLARPHLAIAVFSLKVLVGAAGLLGVYKSKGKPAL